MNTNELNITNSRHNIKLIGEKDRIVMANLPSDDWHYDCAWFSLIDTHGRETNSARVVKYKGRLTFNVPYAPPGQYRLQCLFQASPHGGSFTGSKENICLVIGSDRMVRFESSPVYEHNVQFFGKLRTDLATIERCKQIPPGDNAAIIKKAYEITRGCLTDYSKALAIHDWIADNIYYDLDSYTSGRICYAKLGNASEVFSSKLAVCSGYSDLTRLMLRAVGIPAMTISCYALGRSTAQKWTSDNIKQGSNHAITLAFIQKRWIIIDTTWDSGNKYQNGKFQQKGGTSHRYFDSTLQYFSSTHKFCA